MAVKPTFSKIASASSVVKNAKKSFATSACLLVLITYRRQDEIGTPFCITVDFNSLEDNLITLRYRDSMEQVRISLEEAKDIIRKEING